MIDINAPMHELVKKVSGHVASSYPSYITADDVAQNIWIWVYEHVNTVADLVRNDESWERKLYATMSRVGHEASLREEAETNGYSPEDVYHYSVPVIRTLLEDAFDYQDWQSFGSFGDGQPKAKAQANQTGDRIAMLADVKSAWEKLNGDQKDTICMYFAELHNYEKLGQALGISPNAARQRLDRAVKALQRGLGRKSVSDMQQGYSSRRRSFGNAEARAVNERNYSG
jgi:DNA-directed RNA polymerase specialized sigma24 family protein